MACISDEAWRFLCKVNIDRKIDLPRKRGNATGFFLNCWYTIRVVGVILAEEDEIVNTVKRFLHRAYTIIMMPGYVMGTTEFPASPLNRR